MTNTVFIPPAGSTVILAEDWQFSLEWTKRNLVLLRKYGLTGMKKEVWYSTIKYDDNHNPVKDDNGNYVYEQQYRNATVPNPIFKDYDGEYTPALITLPADTELYLQQYAWRAIDFKIMKSPDVRFKERVFTVDREEFNGVKLKDQ